MNESNDNLLHRFHNDFSIFITATEAIRKNCDNPDIVKKISQELLENKEKYLETLEIIKKKIRQ